MKFIDKKNWFVCFVIYVSAIILFWVIILNHLDKMKDIAIEGRHTEWKARVDMEESFYRRMHIRKTRDYKPCPLCGK